MHWHVKTTPAPQATLDHCPKVRFMRLTDTMWSAFDSRHLDFEPFPEEAAAAIPLSVWAPTVVQGGSTVMMHTVHTTMVLNTLHTSTLHTIKVQNSTVHNIWCTPKSPPQCTPRCTPHGALCRSPLAEFGRVWHCKGCCWAGSWSPHSQRSDSEISKKLRFEWKQLKTT